MALSRGYGLVNLLQSRNPLITCRFCNYHVYSCGIASSELIQRRVVRHLASSINQIRCKSNKDITSLFVPVPVKVANNPDDINVGEELTAKLNKDEVKKYLSQFVKKPEIRQLAQEHGLNGQLFKEASVSFLRYCVNSDNLPADLHITFNDIIQGAGHVDDIFPYFLRHAKEVFPHLQCMDDLKKISDLRLPANWYPEARAMNRKIIFHAGPTNSGKTYHALERFFNAKSGIYCGPLKLLAVEVHAKANKRGTPCDLVTGEEKQFANQDQTPSAHVACTVEMTSVTTPCEVAIIDEIQMLKDMGRGWAWTRALLGVAADEIHLCGEAAAIGLVQEICSQIGEDVEVRKYKRLTKLTVESEPLGSLENVRPGDCIVCFSKNDIYAISRQIEKIGRQCALIYGGLPPGTKLAQANKFNDENDPCKILVATDAIGMGLNLSIRRIIFHSLVKPTLNENGEKEMDTLSTSQALQIAGRAGRFGTPFAEGFVTTFRAQDLHTLQTILKRPIEPIKMAGLHPTADQIELFAYHLPQSNLSSLIDIFVTLCQVDDSRYFMCNVDDFKFLADMVQHIALPLRDRYVFCCAPINKKMPFVCTMFIKIARKYSMNEPLTFDWLCRSIGWPFSPPNKISDLVHLEAIFDVLDLYLWLSYRFQDLFPEADLVRNMQQELDSIIQAGVLKMTLLLKNSETAHSHGTHDDDSFDMQNRSNKFGPEDISLTSDQRIPESKNKIRSLLNDMDVANEDDLDHDDSSPPSVGRGRLANHLISQGLLTPRMLQELRKEWKEDSKNKSDSSSISKIVKRKPRKKK